MIIIPVVISYFIMKSAIQKAIMHYARAVDDVFFEKDKKIEDLEYRLSDMQARIESLENELSHRNSSDFSKYGI